ncbi:MAG: hypothetical protein ABII90_14495, partial [Bacteroidota bacterium]
MTRFLFILLILLNVSYIDVHSQDASKEVSLSYNILRGIIDEHTFGFEYKPLKKHSFTISLGYVYKSIKLREKFKTFSPRQDFFPILLY